MIKVSNNKYSNNNLFLTLYNMIFTQLLLKKKTLFYLSGRQKHNLYPAVL